jgi:hypothetical protein
MKWKHTSMDALKFHTTKVAAATPIVATTVLATQFDGLVHQPPSQEQHCQIPFSSEIEKKKSSPEGDQTYLG